jgi:hypothetical protein
MNLRPGGISREKLEPRAAVTSGVRWVCCQYSNWSRPIKTGSLQYRLSKHRFLKLTFLKAHGLLSGYIGANVRLVKLTRPALRWVTLSTCGKEGLSLKQSRGESTAMHWR